MDIKNLKEILRRRAQEMAAQTHLVVDYYRIRRRVAYPLPVQKYEVFDMPILPPSVDKEDYPWSIWLLWCLEERIFTLGWAGHHLEEPTFRKLVSRDLEAFGKWPAYRQLRNTPDLGMGHSARMLATAFHHWSWLPPETRKSLQDGLRRLMEDGIPELEKRLGPFRKREQILADYGKHRDPKKEFHNIPFIGSLGIAMAANVLKDPRSESLNQRILEWVLAALDIRKEGFSEGISYDGYLLDLIADWMLTFDPKNTAAIRTHPRFGDFLQESVGLGAPGNILEVNELSDVEPWQMLFHVSAQAKVHQLEPSPSTAWYLGQCNPIHFRGDAIAAILSQKTEWKEKAPLPGIIDASYATVLRSGWGSQDVAVTIACSPCVMGHIHFDNGSVEIGSSGDWFIADPGYQQYRQTSERQFSYGPKSHNFPVINGRVQTVKKPSVLASSTQGDLLQAGWDITACYPPETLVENVTRKAWLKSNQWVVIADQVRGKGVDSVEYFWHGNPLGAWWIQDSWAQVHLNGRTLWFRSPQLDIQWSNLSRLKGSRGHLTLETKISRPPQWIWWIFSFDRPAGFSLEKPESLRVESQLLEFPSSSLSL